MPHLQYLYGDATEPVYSPSMICHCCNSDGLWGKGFVLSLSKKFPEPETAYRKWFKDQDYMGLGKPEIGKCQIVKVKPDLWVANLIGQRGVKWDGQTPPIRYGALERALTQAYSVCSENKMTLHAPRLGCDLAGGQWSEVEAILKKVMTVDTCIYTLPSQASKWGK